MATLEGLENPPSRPEVAAGRHLWPRLASLPLIPSLVIGALLVMALAAPLLAPYPPTEQNLIERLRPPFWVAGGSMAHPFGTDLFGRDVLSRVVYGARVSLSLTLMRIVDAFLAVPAVLIAIVLASTLGPSFQNVIVVIGVLYWPRYARQLR